MSDGVTIILILCVTAFILTTMICATKVALADRKVRQEREDEARERYHGALDRAVRPQPPMFEYSKTERLVPRDEPAPQDGPEPEPQDEAKPPLPIDPQNPPKTIRFPLNEANPPLCVCHGLKIKPGQRVVAWPDGPGYRFFCTTEGE